MSNSLVQNTYNSDEDDDADLDALFADYDFETIATQPLPRVDANAGHHVTQPTQLLATPQQQKRLASPAPPDVQVTASSPFQASPEPPSNGSHPSALSRGPKPPQLQKGALNGGLLAHTLAPPGTQFRSPYQAQQKSQNSHARSQTVELEFSDDEDVDTLSSDEDERRPAGIKQSVFMRDGKPINAAGQPTKIEESPRQTDFSRFAYADPPLPQKRSVDDMADAYVNSRDPKAPRNNHSIFIKGGKTVNAAIEPTRIEESPKQTDSSSCALDGPPLPLKRSADAMAEAYATSRKPKVPRQTEPARALPVEQPDISIDEIMDWNMQNKVKSMRYALGDTASVRMCRDALVLKHMNYSDAIGHVAAQMDREERIARLQPATAKAPAKPTVDLTGDSDGDELTGKTPVHNMTKLGVKRDVKNVKSITQKWASTTQNSKPSQLVHERDEPSGTPPPKKPKRRLIRPPRSPSPPPLPAERPRRRLIRPLQSPSSPVLNSSPPIFSKKPEKSEKLQAGKQPTQNQQIGKQQTTQKPILIGSDTDEGVALPSDDSDSDADRVRSRDQSAAELKLLKFLNECTLDELVEISNQPLANIKKVLEHRPFANLEAARDVCIETTTSGSGKARTMKKQIGDRLVDVCLEVLEGYEAVDNLVAECEELGKPLRKEMERLGYLNATQTGELQLVDLDSVDHDSGIGTSMPSSPASFDEDLDPQAKTRTTKTMTPKKGLSLSQPALMSSHCTLKDYQVTGLNWLAQLFSNNMSGILADDMGLGKTIQVIAFLAHLNEIGTEGPHLVIVPGSTLENWLREFRNFCPKLRVEPYYGSQKERPELQIRLLDELEDINVIVTTYDMAVSSGSDSKFLKRTKPVVCVFDEGHTLKNSQTKRYKELMRIPAHFRLLLTGTPLQNNLQELMALLGFIMPEVFAKHQEQLETVFKHKAKAASCGNDNSGRAALLSAQRISRARSMITPFILRRKKEQVLKHLPKKTCRVELCELSETQSKIYHAEFENGKRSLLNHANGDTVGAKLKTNVLMEMRKAAIHPLLFRHRFDDETLRKMSTACLKEPDFSQSNPQYVWEDFSVMTDFEIDRFCHKYVGTMSNFALPASPAPCMDSGKVCKLVEILTTHVRNKDRTLVFSQFTMVMDILEQVFQTEGISFSRLDGSTKMQERQDLIDQFTNDTSISVFMLSTKAGGAGINLTSANKVVIFDSSFNPQDDIQAENRAHRVGQDREVEVVRLVTKGTIEEQIYELGQTKLVLDARVAGDGGQNQKDADFAEKSGMDLVVSMMKDGIGGAKGKEEDKIVEKENEPVMETSDHTDLKDAYMNGLQKAGLTLAST